MKKTITFIYFLIAISFFSCSDDDVDTSERLIGEWILIEEQVGETVNDLSECRATSTASFTSDYSYTFIYYTGDPGACVILNNQTGTWEKSGANTYFFEPVAGAPGSAKATFEGDTVILLFDDLAPALKVTYRRID